MTFETGDVLLVLNGFKNINIILVIIVIIIIVISCKHDNDYFLFIK